MSRPRLNTRTVYQTKNLRKIIAIEPPGFHTVWYREEVLSIPLPWLVYHVTTYPHYAHPTQVVPYLTTLSMSVTRPKRTTPLLTVPLPNIYGHAPCQGDAAQPVPDGDRYAILHETLAGWWGSHFNGLSYNNAHKDLKVRSIFPALKALSKMTIDEVLAVKWEHASRGDDHYDVPVAPTIKSFINGTWG